jgi:hypothetical protein
MGYNVAHKLMLNFNNLKYIFMMIMIVPGLYLAILFVNSLSNQPDIKDIGIIKFDDIISDQSLTKSQELIVGNQSDANFDYKLIGIRSGGKDSSVIVKKANKEFLVVVGEMLEGRFELIEVTSNSAVFRNGQKVYRINYDEKN